MRTFLLTFLLGSLPSALLATQWTTCALAEFQNALELNKAGYESMVRMKVETLIQGFEHASATTPANEYTSVVWRNGNMIKAEQLNIQTYQTSDLRWVIDPEQKLIMLSDPELDVFHTTARISDLSLYKITLTEKMVLHGGGVKYRITLGQGLPFEKIEVDFDKNDWIREVDLYYRPSAAYVEPGAKPTAPRIRLMITPPEPISANAFQVRLEDHLAYRDGQYGPARAWKDYQVFDTRSR